MEFGLLGPFEATHGGEALRIGGGKQRALLALLALNAGRTVSSEQLVDQLWGEDVPGTAPKMVQIYVSQLRKALPDGVLRTRPPGYGLDVDPEQVDVQRFERALRDGREALASGDAARAAATLRAGLALWRGEALAEFGAEPFARVEGRRLEELRLSALEERIEADLALGRHADVVGELDALVALHPLRERLRGQQLVALYRSGRQAEALASYQDARRVLDEQLGIRPSAALRELERRILNQDEALLAATPVAAAWRRAGDGGARAPEPIGRDAELGRLERHLAAVVEGRKEVVLVSGEAGVGKTTLVEAFLAKAEALDDVQVARGQCVEQGGSGEAYMPILQALDGLCRNEAGRAVVDLLARRAPTWLVQLPGVVEPDELERLERRIYGTTRERMLRELLAALDELTTRRALVLALEDLHWSDPSTVDLIAAVARRAEHARVLVIGTFRPDEPGDQPRPFSDVARDLRSRAHASELALAPLPLESVAELVARRLAGDDDHGELAAIVHGRSGGNPLFVQTLLDAWVGPDGVLAGDVEPAELATHVPETLRELIDARLSRLDRADVELLEAGSVAGATFDAAAIAAALERPLDDVERRCTELARHGRVIRERGAASWPDGTVTARFAFGHDLYREVVYDAVPDGVRARLHERLARRAEEAWGERVGEIAAELAVHFDRSQNHRSAAVHHYRAAVQALRFTAHSEALAHIRRGLRTLAELPDDRRRDRLEHDLASLLGPSLFLTEGWQSEEGERTLLRALELAERLDEPELVARMLYRLATMYEVRGEYDRTHALLERSLAEPARQLRVGLLVDSHELMACTLFHQGEFDGALAHADQGVAAYAGDPGDPVTAALGDNPGVACRTWAGLALWFLGDRDGAFARAREAVALSASEERRHGRATAFAHAAVLAQIDGDHELAAAWAEAAIEAGRASGYRYRVAMGTIVHGWAIAAAGDPELGMETLANGLELSRATGARMDDAYYLGVFADVARLAGRLGDAQRALDEALAFVPGGRSFFYEPELHRLAGEVADAAGDPATARTALERALDVARRRGARPLELRAAVALADHLRAAGERGAAVRVLEATLDGSASVDGRDGRAARELLDVLRSA